MKRLQHPRLITALAWAIALVALGAVFMLYTRPAFMVTLIDQLWACF
jgi:flagellar biosynthesis/type III secretory pathway M-ring protein FliF/YscJ